MEKTQENKMVWKMNFPPKHTKAVRCIGERNNSKVWYTEFDINDRIVYSRDSHGYFSYRFYTDEPHIATPYFILHKYHRLYNPEFV